MSLAMRKTLFERIFSTVFLLDLFPNARLSLRVMSVFLLMCILSVQSVSASEPDKDKQATLVVEQKLQETKGALQDSQKTAAPLGKQEEGKSASLPISEGQDKAASPQTPAPVSQDAVKASNTPKGFTPPVALVKRLASETDLPAMQLSLSLINFVGDTEPARHGEEVYAILPLGHDSILEVYDLNYDGTELILADTPQVVRKMSGQEAYVLHVPTFAGDVPTKAICVNTHGQKYCWNPKESEDGLFLHWSSTKGIK